MRPHVTGIDHVVILVRDLDRAQESFTRMGFTLTPRGHHTLGSQNHCVMLGRDYFELLAIPKPHPAMQTFCDFLARGEGVGGMALATDDAAAVHQGLRDDGVPVDAPIDFSRPVELPGGVRDAAFRVVQLAPTFTAGMGLFLCQHFARDVVWRSDCLAHPVGATGLAGLALAVDDPARAAPAYARVFGAAPVPVAEGLLVPTGSAPVVLTTRARIRRRLAGVVLPRRRGPLVCALFIRVADRARAGAALRAGGFHPVVLQDGSLAIGADQAHGVAVVFG